VSKRLNSLKLNAYIILLDGKKIKPAKIKPICLKLLKLSAYIVLLGVKKIKFTKIKRLRYFSWW